MIPNDQVFTQDQISQLQQTQQTAVPQEQLSGTVNQPLNLQMLSQSQAAQNQELT